MAPTPRKLRTATTAPPIRPIMASSFVVAQRHCVITFALPINKPPAVSYRGLVQDVFSNL